MAFLTIFAIGLICLAFKSTRLIGVIGLTLMALVLPFVFVTLLAIAGAYFYFTRKRRNLNVYKIDQLD